MRRPWRLVPPEPSIHNRNWSAIMRARSLPSQERLVELLSYAPDTGELLWKRANGNNRVVAGSRAGTPIMQYKDPSSRAGKIISVDGVRYKTSRIIWTMVHGLCPLDREVDHINRDPWDDRLQNLRLATNSQNKQNRRVNRSSKSGLRGVGFSHKRGKFLARITRDGKRICLGMFKTPEEASRAYVEAAEALYGKDFACAK